MKKDYLIIFSIIIFMILAYDVSAMTPTFPNEIRFSRGVGNTCYWISNTASNYGSEINSAANNWMYTGWDNPIYMTAVSSNYATHMDFYGVHLGSASDVLAYTLFFNDYGMEISSQNGNTNYFYTEIWLNTNSVNGYTAHHPSVVKHEMGHAFGLSHWNNMYSIMHVIVDNQQVTTVQKVDNDTINYLY